MAQICTKSFVGWGFAPDSTGGAYSAPPDPLAGFKGPTSKGRERERRAGEGREGRGARPVCLLVLRGGKGREGKEERKGRKVEMRGREGKGRGGERDLAPLEKKS